MKALTGDESDSEPFDSTCVLYRLSAKRRLLQATRGRNRGNNDVAPAWRARRARARGAMACARLHVRVRLARGAGEESSSSCHRTIRGLHVQECIRGVTRWPGSGKRKGNPLLRDRLAHFVCLSLQLQIGRRLGQHGPAVRVCRRRSLCRRSRCLRTRCRRVRCRRLALRGDRLWSVVRCPGLAVLRLGSK